MMKYRKGMNRTTLFLLAVLTLFSCAKEQIYDTGENTHGVNGEELVDVVLPFTTNGGMESIWVTRAADLDSQLSSVLLLVYEAVDPLKPELNKVVTSRFYKKASNAGDMEGWFPLPEDLTRGLMKMKCPTGDVYIYLVANWTNSFLEYAEGVSEQFLANPDNVPQNQMELFKKFVPTWKGNVHRVDGLVPMVATVNNTTGLCNVQKDGTITYKDRNGQIQTITQGVYDKDHAFDFTRLMAKVTMNFKTPQGSNATFEPMRFVIKNVAKHIAPTTEMWPADDPEASRLLHLVEDTPAAPFETQSPNSFTVYIPGNLESALPGAKIASWTDREKMVKDASGKNQVHTETALKDKPVFANAPKYGTYIEVTGKFEDPTNDIISAETRFNIHLGNFSKDLYDFDVKRDHHYTYNITVKGVSDIIVESKDNTEQAETHPGEFQEFNPSEDGLVYVGGMRAYCDAHYDQVELKLSRNAFKNDFAVIFASTPFGPVSAYYYPKGSMKNGVPRSEGELKFLTKKVNTREKAMSYLSWVKMKRETTPGQLETYPAPGRESVELTNIFDALDKVWTTGETAYYTCFIDEYYYTQHPDLDKKEEKVHLRDFVNKADRSVAVGHNIYISKDGNSVSVDAVYVVYQKSIATFYDLKDNSITKFGVETYSETGRFPNYGSPRQQSKWVWDGRSNTEAEINYEKCVNWAKNGWLIQNVNGKEILVDQGMNRLNPNYQQAYLACLTRNRDFNGNGIIDIEELRWYTPALRQLIAIWIGEPALPRKAALFTGLTSNLKTAMKCEHAVYSSSSGNKRQLWAEQGCSYGEDSRNGGEVKVIRNLGKDVAEDKWIVEKPEYFFKYDQNTRTIEVFLNDVALRSFSATELEPHDERSPINRVYKKIQLANHPHYSVKKTRYCWYAGQYYPYYVPLLSNATEAKTKLQSYAAQYPGDGEIQPSAETGTWRLPNQRELALMVLAAGENFQVKEGLDEELYRTTDSGNCSHFNGHHWNSVLTKDILHCRTRFSNSVLSGGTYTEWGFMYNTRQNLIQMMWKKDAGDDFGMGTDGTAGYFCVRDVR